MPTVTVPKAEFYKALGKEYTSKFGRYVFASPKYSHQHKADEFDELCFQYGLELVGVLDCPLLTRANYFVAG